VEVACSEVKGFALEEEKNADVDTSASLLWLLLLLLSSLVVPFPAAGDVEAAATADVVPMVPPTSLPRLEPFVGGVTVLSSSSDVIREEDDEVHEVVLVLPVFGAVPILAIVAAILCIFDTNVR